MAHAPCPCLQAVLAEESRRLLTTKLTEAAEAYGAGNTATGLAEIRKIVGYGTLLGALFEVSGLEGDEVRATPTPFAVDARTPDGGDIVAAAVAPSGASPGPSGEAPEPASIAPAAERRVRSPSDRRATRGCERPDLKFSPLKRNNKLLYSS